MWSVIQTTYDFLVNDVFGSLWLFALFIIIIILGIWLMARVPQFALPVVGVGVLSLFYKYEYVIPTWVYIMSWVALGYVWFTVIRHSLGE